MTTLQTQYDDRQNNEHNNLFPITLESELRLPLIRNLFTGHFNGFNVEVHSSEEMAMLYHMGCFGKRTVKPVGPRLSGEGTASIMRKRQFAKRILWYDKFSKKVITESDEFLRDVDKLLSKIRSDKKSQKQRDVIDLVSSDEEVMDVRERDSPVTTAIQKEDDDIVVIVPNSDSEGENYFENLKPICCINKTTMQHKLILTLQEAFFLMYGLGCLQILNCENKVLNTQNALQLFSEVDRNFVVNYVVYHYYRSKGYVVKPGLKFGGDYLLYREGPGFAHADYIVVIKPENCNSRNWTEFLGHLRMAGTTAKEILIAEVHKSNDSPKSLEIPEVLSSYSLKELCISRNIPLEINNEND